MKNVELRENTIEQEINNYLEFLGKEDEFDRIINSMWTEITKNRVISLDLSRLDIIEFNPSILETSRFSSLKYLYLQGNKIENLDPYDFNNLINLEGLNLPNNNIGSLTSSWFSSLSNLEWLNLSSNSINKVERSAFEGLGSLSTLNLSHNKLQTIENGTFSNLPSLDKLNLSNNDLKKIQGGEFEGLANLRVLNLQSNTLVKVNHNLPSVLPNLEELHLKHNPAFPLHNSFKSRVEILEVLRTSDEPHRDDMVMTELLNYEDDEIIATFNQLIEDPRWDGGIGRVSNYKLSKTTGLPIETIARKIENLITQKKLSNIVHYDNNTPMAFENHYWIRTSQSKKSINSGINDPKCLWCNTELLDPFDACPACDLRCEICKFSIKQTQEFDVCTSESELACLDIFHRSEYLEWVRIYGSCPKCGQDIDLNLYQVSKDYSQKLGALVEQEMELPISENSRNDFLIPMALSILVNLKTIQNDILSSEMEIKKIGRKAREHHQEILNELQPLATEIVLITAFLDRLEAKSLTEESFKASIERIAQKFDVFENNLDIIYKAHQKDKTKLSKIKEMTVKGSKKGGGVGVKALAERSGLIGKIKKYVSLPTKEGLKSILSRIGKGIRDKTGDPTAWIKLGAVFII